MKPKMTIKLLLFFALLAPMLFSHSGADALPHAVESGGIVLGFSDDDDLSGDYSSNGADSGEGSAGESKDGGDEAANEASSSQSGEDMDKGVIGGDSSKEGSREEEYSHSDLDGGQIDKNDGSREGQDEQNGGDQEQESLADEDKKESADGDGSSEVEAWEVPPQDMPQFVTSLEELGNWTSYNGIIFERASFYQSQSGGGLAVGGDLAFHRDLRIGSTYTTEYDSTLHIGEYKNEDGFPALLFGGKKLEVDAGVSSLEVYGGAITMTPEMLEHHNKVLEGVPLYVSGFDDLDTVQQVVALGVFHQGGRPSLAAVLTICGYRAVQHMPVLPKMMEHRGEAARPASVGVSDTGETEQTHPLELPEQWSRQDEESTLIHESADQADQMLAIPEEQEPGGKSAALTPMTGSGYQAADQLLLDEWFSYQRKMVEATSRLMLQANDESIDIGELGAGSYLQDGPDRFQNRYLEVNGEVYHNALFVTVRTGSEVNFGQWWPVHSVICLDVNWAINYDLLVFNFPDAVNVTMNSSTFDIKNMEHWSTTVDAWIGERGMLERRALAEKVVYNFPSARSVEASQALIQGTVLAPGATFTGVGQGDNGHIYGHIVAKNLELRGNFTVHAFALTHWLYDIVEDAVKGEQETGAINLRHYLYFGEATSIPAPGAEFYLQQESGSYYDGRGGFVEDQEQAAVYSTSPEEYTQIRDVPLGSYSVVLRRAPEGFTVNLSNLANPATYYHYPVVLSLEGETVQAVRYSEPELTDLYFRKVDMDTGKGLAGAVFTLVREADEYQDATIGGTYTSGEDGVFASLRVPVGRYHLVEVETPAGHGLLQDGEYPFQVVWDAESGRLMVQDREGQLHLADERQPLDIANPVGAEGNTLTVVKYTPDLWDPDVYHPLPGAEFALYRFDEEAGQWRRVTANLAGEEVALVTNEFGYRRVGQLDGGEYRVVEVRTPAGYASANRYTDEAFPGGYAHVFAFTPLLAFHTAYLPGEAIKQDITLISLGSPFGDPQPLSGTSFRLEHLLVDGKTWEELIYAIATEQQGMITLEGLPAGQYRLTQLEASRGYRLLDPARIYFSIAYNSDGEAVVEATYDGIPLTGDTRPVWTEEDGTRILLESEAITSSYEVYKADANIISAPDGEGKPSYTVQYLEDGVFRLRRRADVRSGWRDYGPAFRSAFAYGEDGMPLLDSYGNHIALAPFPYGLIFGDYQLVEVEPPEGYRPASEIEVTFDDGETGTHLHLFSVTQEMTVNGQAVSYTAFNQAEGSTATLRFRVADWSDREVPVKGAEFALYQCELSHQHDAGLEPGSCWTASTPVNAVSNMRGLVVFDDLETGDYLLRENQTPTGYQLPNTMWLIQVDAGGQSVLITPTNGSAYSFVHTGQEEAEWLLPNRRQFWLPGTGGRGTRIYTVAGVLILSAAAAILWINGETKRRKDNEKN